MRATSDAVILLEALYSEEQVSVGLVMLSPPRRAGRMKSSLSRELIDFLPVIAGRRRFRMESSRGCRALAMFGVVRVRWVHLLERPWVKAAYAAWGCDTAMVARCFTSSTH